MLGNSSNSPGLSWGSNYKDCFGRIIYSLNWLLMVFPFPFFLFPIDFYFFFQWERLCKLNYNFLSENFEEKIKGLAFSHPPVLDFIQTCCAHDNILALTNGKILDASVEYRCVLSLPSAEDMSYDFFLLMVWLSFWTFVYHTSNIPQNVLIISVCCRHYANILFLRLLKALLLIHHKRHISKQIIAPNPCSVGTQACTKTKYQVLILQHELLWCFTTHHFNGISAVEKEWKFWFCLII